MSRTNIDDARLYGCILGPKFVNGDRGSDYDGQGDSGDRRTHDHPQQRGCADVPAPAVLIQVWRVPRSGVRSSSSQTRTRRVLWCFRRVRRAPSPPRLRGRRPRRLGWCVREARQPTLAGSSGRRVAMRLARLNPGFITLAAAQTHI